MNEFNIIERFFTRPTASAVGIGDDCAVVNIPEGKQLCVTTDTLISDVHFPKNTLPADIGYKSLAVSLSDLASCAATPAFATLNLTLPDIDKLWLKEFSRGFFKCADAFGIPLIGGDTTHGPLSITVTANGFVDRNKALLRSNACVGDAICVTGPLGDAALYLAGKLKSESARRKLDHPTPRVETGLLLRDIATSCIDISDGLSQDLHHILNQSHVGAELHTIPLSEEASNVDGAGEHALSGGDDYELCFTAPRDALAHLPKETHIEIGVITEKPGCVFIDSTGNQTVINPKGFLHF